VDAQTLKKLIRDIPDFPKPGILFRDITPLLLEPQALTAAVDAMATPFLEAGVQRVLGIESRGFLLGPLVAQRLDAGFGLVRKGGRLPYQTRQVSYDLEYGSDVIEMHVDTISAGQRVLIVDDLLATGGTAAATVELARQAEGEVVGASFLIELTALSGARRLDVGYEAVIRY
jgi:adenine phosphoribosyltransferase